MRGFGNSEIHLSRGEDIRGGEGRWMWIGAHLRHDNEFVARKTELLDGIPKDYL